MMPIILFLILTLSTASPFFSTSPLSLTIASADASQSIPQKYRCSCEIVVFPIQKDRYNLTIKTDESNVDGFRMKIKSSGSCLEAKIGTERSVTFEIDNTQFQQYQITQIFWIQTRGKSSQNESNDCQGIEERGQERTVYLVNKTRQQVQGQYKYLINLPQEAIAVTQISAFIVLVLLSHNIKYRRFTPIPFSLLFVLIYASLLFGTIYLDTLLEAAMTVTYWVTMIFALLCSLIFLIDLNSLCISSNITIFVISLIVTLLIGLADILILPNSWPFNNLIAFLTIGILIKFIVIKKLKASIFPLLLLWVFFIFRQFVVLFHVQNFEQVMHIKIVPLFLQLPAMIGDDDTGFICSAFGTSKIITIGFIINYCVRVDLFLSTKFYTILSTTLAFFCLALEYVLQLIFDQLPVLQYASVIIFLPLAFLSILMVSSKRGEWAELWHGSFHDIAVDRKSIKRQSSSLLDDEELGRSLEESLKMNPSLIRNGSI